MSNRLVTVATFYLPNEAYMARNLLTEARITSIVADDDVISTITALSNAIGGVKLQVMERDAAQAAAILDDRYRERRGDAADQTVGETPVDVQEAWEEPTEEDFLVRLDPAEEPLAKFNEQDVRLLVIFAFVGLAMPFVACYVLYRFGSIESRTQAALSPRGRFLLYLAGILAALSVTWMLIRVAQRIMDAR